MNLRDFTPYFLGVINRFTDDHVYEKLVPLIDGIFLVVQELALIKTTYCCCSCSFREGALLRRPVINTGIGVSNLSPIAGDALDGVDDEAIAKRRDRLAYGVLKRDDDDGPTLRLVNVERTAQWIEAIS